MQALLVLYMTHYLLLPGPLSHVLGFGPFQRFLEFLNHRQLSDPDAPTFADHMSSIRMAEALIPDFRTELAEVLGLSARGLVGHGVVTGTSTDGVAVEIPLIQLVLFDGERVTHVEDFDPSQRDLALARFEELNQRGELPRA